jgi:hypothetical protein
MDEIRQAIIDIVKENRPMTVRQVFYQLVVRDLIEKTENEYKMTVVRLLIDLRMSDKVSFEDIIDDSRRRRENQTFDSIADAARDTARFYRRNALSTCPDYVEIWCEKEALMGIIENVAGDYDVPIIPSKGMASLTQLYETSEYIARAAHHGKRTYIYQFGDHDPTGVKIPQAMERRLDELCDEKWDCPYPIIERVALTEEQIEDYDLPTRPTKREGNRHAKDFEGDSVELDALPPDVLRGLVKECIEQHISEHELSALRAAEESEREQLEIFARRIEEDAA